MFLSPSPRSHNQSRKYAIETSQFFLQAFRAQLDTESLQQNRQLADGPSNLLPFESPALKTGEAP
jgi:hypothetical protein